jgi:hypothetical protein
LLISYQSHLARIGLAVATCLAGNTVATLPNQSQDFGNRRLHRGRQFDAVGYRCRGEKLEEEMEASELTLVKRVVHLDGDVLVAIPDAVKADPRVPSMAHQTTKTRAMTIAMIGILIMPLYGLMAGDENLWERLQALVESERAAKSQSTVLAVDTKSLQVRSKSSSPAIKEFFEQTALEHLARLQHTFNSWSERNQELMGSVSLKIAIDSIGNVVRVEAVNPRMSNSNFIKTVMDDVREWKFSSGRSEAAEMTVPLLFIPKGMNPDMIVQWERTVYSVRRDDSPTQPLPSSARVTGKMTEDGFAKPISTQQEHQKVAATLAGARRQVEKLLPVVIANRQLAIRANPRYSANSVREVEEATQLSILENRGDWLKVRTAQGDAIGFIRKEYVSPSNG